MDITSAIIPVAGLGITVVVLASVFFTLYRVFGGMSTSNQERQRLLREGIQAPAQVLGVQMGGMTMTVGVHRHLQLQIALQVQPQGRPPYQATLTTMISELQIPQIQPGVTVTVRYDANNPMQLALEGVGAPGGAAAAPAPGAGNPPGHPGAAVPAQGYGAPGYAGATPGQPGYPAPAPGAPPVYPGAVPMGPAGVQPRAMVPIGGMPGMPQGAKIGLVLGIAGAVVGVLVAVVVVAVNVLGVGLGDAADTGSGVCAQAARCCQTIGGPADTCKNFGKLGVPDSACKSALEGYRRMATAQGKSCE